VSVGPTELTYLIEDELHADYVGRFETFEEASNELQRLALVPWDEDPNQALCTSWQSCGREYSIVEFDSAVDPWREVRRISALRINAAGIIWAPHFNM
jgi:hypothetical protein